MGFIRCSTTYEISRHSMTEDLERWRGNELGLYCGTMGPEFSMSSFMEALPNRFDLPTKRSQLKPQNLQNLFAVGIQVMPANDMLDFLGGFNDFTGHMVLEDDDSSQPHCLASFAAITQKKATYTVSFKIKCLKAPWGRDEIPEEVMKALCDKDGVDCLISGHDFKFKLKGKAEYTVDVTCSDIIMDAEPAEGAEPVENGEPAE